MSQLSRFARTAFTLAAFVLAGAATAQTYPSKPIRIIVPYTAGGTSDILARFIGPKLTEAWGQPVMVESKPGANGNLGADYVSKSAPDGYTVLLGDIGALAISPSVYPNLPFDPVKDFTPVIMVSYSPHILAVHPSLPVSGVKELIDYAKAHVGQLNFALAGTGSAPHLAGIEFAQRTGVSWTYIPYKGGSQAVLDVVAGQSNVLFNGMLATYPQVRNGKLKALAVSSAKRVAAAPDLPTVAESGLPGFVTGSWQGVVAPPGVPREIVLKMNAEFARILNTQDMKEKLAAQGTEVRADTPEAFAAFIRDEKVRWAKVVKESGAKFE